MKLVYTTLQSNIEIESGIFNSVIVENQNYYYQLVRDLKLQMDGKEGGWILSNNDKPLVVSKNIELFTDYFDINCNHKTIITKQIQNRIVYEDFKEYNNDRLQRLWKYAQLSGLKEFSL